MFEIILTIALLHFAVEFLDKYVNEGSYADYDKQALIREESKKLNLKKIIRRTDYLYRI